MTDPGRHGNRRRAGAPRGNAGVGVHDFTPVFPDFDPPRCRAKLPARLATERSPCPTGDARKSRNQSAAAGAGGAARTSVGADNDGRRQLVKRAASPRVRGIGQDRADEQRSASSVSPPTCAPMATPQRSTRPRHSSRRRGEDGWRGRHCRRPRTFVSGNNRYPK